MSIIDSLRLVFSSSDSGKAYVALAAAVAAGFWVLFGILDQMLFLSPVLAFYIPSDAYVSFLLSALTAVLLGIVVSMNVYVFRNSRVKVGASLFSGSALSVASSACAGCTSAGFFFATTFGIAGATATSLLAQYQLPLRLVGVGLLVWALYSVNRRLNQSCPVK
ncbi:hypothetical protein [Nitrososphaera sp.]|uniref:hypothetical protein n=1 Tax=Nitrososphaera sp. TaxID=1971748 RepID=UPI00307E6594